MLAHLLRGCGALSVLAGLWNGVTVLQQSVHANAVGLNTGLAAPGLTLSWTLVLLGLVAFGVGQLLARQHATENPQRRYAERD